jgi:hypothetical protein
MDSSVTAFCAAVPLRAVVVFMFPSPLALLRNASFESRFSPVKLSNASSAPTGTNVGWTLNQTPNSPQLQRDSVKNAARIASNARNENPDRCLTKAHLFQLGTMRRNGDRRRQTSEP